MTGFYQTLEYQQKPHRLVRLVFDLRSWVNNCDNGQLKALKRCKKQFIIMSDQDLSSVEPATLYYMVKKFPYEYFSLKLKVEKTQDQIFKTDSKGLGWKDAKITWTTADAALRCSYCKGNITTGQLINKCKVSRIHNNHLCYHCAMMGIAAGLPIYKELNPKEIVPNIEGLKLLDSEKLSASFKTKKVSSTEGFNIDWAKTSARISFLT